MSRSSASSSSTAGVGEFSYAEASSLLADSSSKPPSARRPRPTRPVQITLPEKTWIEAIGSNVPQIILGLGVVLFGCYVAYKCLNAKIPQGGRGRGKKQQYHSKKQRKHGLIDDNRKPIGLRNVGNSCFLNALLQALQSSSPFLQYLLRLQSLSVQLHALPNAQLAEFLRAGAEPEESTQYRVYMAQRQIQSAYDFLTSLLHLLVPRMTIADGEYPSSALDPGQFYDLLLASSSGSSRMRQERGQQQDAHELFLLLTHQLETHARAIAQLQERAAEGLGNQKRGLEELLDNNNSPQPNRSPSASPAPNLTSSSGSISSPPPVPASRATSSTDLDASLLETDSDHSESATSPTNSQSMASSIEQEERAGEGGTEGNIKPATSHLASQLSSLSLPLPPDPFTGLQAHFLLCNMCKSSKSPGVNHTEFNSITLSFHEGRSGLSVNSQHLDKEDLTLESMLRQSVKFEQVESVRCENCKEAQRRLLLRALMSEVAASRTKGAGGKQSEKKQSALMNLLVEAEQEVFQRLAILQPTSGEYLKRKREELIEKQLKEMLSGGKEQLEKANGTAPAQVATANQTPAPSNLSRSPSSSSSDGKDYFQTLLWQLSNEAFLSSLPASSHERLRAICTVDERRTFSKGTALARIPPSICFHLNRLMGGISSSKVTQHVPFPLRINMYPYTARFAHAELDAHILSMAGRNASRWTAGVSRAASAAMSSSTDVSVLDPSELSYIYDLDAVVVHLGGGAGGHYIAYRRQVQKAQPAPGMEHQSNKDESKPPAADPNEIQFRDEVESENTDGQTSKDTKHAPGTSPFSLSSSSAPASVSSSTDVITWWYFSDDRFYEVDVEEVKQAQAYMLIYTQTYPSTKAGREGDNAKGS